MKKIVFLVLILVITLSACTANNEETSKNESTDVPINTPIEPRNNDNFLKILTEDGFEYTVGESSGEESFFSVERQYVLIGDDIISFYEYETNEAMEADAACVDRGGCSINVPGRSVCISWVSLPHFFKGENLIINYVGENDRILDFLEANYGKEFAGAGR